MGHTPGPWRYEHETERGFWIDGPTYNDDGDALASEADARLIAAAPELLEALERLLDNGEMPHPLSGRDPTVREEDVGPARAAIARAKGEQ